MGIKYLVPTLVLTTGHLFSQQSGGTFLGSQMALPEKAPDEKKKIPRVGRVGKESFVFILRLVVFPKE